MKIKVSSETFNEIAIALQKQGKEVNGNVVQLEKNDEIEQPVDFRLATIRRDCLMEAVKWNDRDENIIETANEMYEFVINKQGVCK